MKFSPKPFAEKMFVHNVNPTKLPKWEYFFLEKNQTTTTTPPPPPKCFPSDAQVKLENGKSVTMSDLQIGNQVQTGKSFLLTAEN